MIEVTGNGTDLREMHTIFFFPLKTDEMLHNSKKRKARMTGGCTPDLRGKRVVLETPVGGNGSHNALFYGLENLKSKFSAISLFWD